MTISKNFIQLQRQIADELSDNQALLEPLGDSDLTQSPIVHAIRQAIAKWERVQFYFNQVVIDTPLNGPYAWQTIAGQEYYSDADFQVPALSSIAYISSMWVLFGGNRYKIEPRTSEYLADISFDVSTQSFPGDYSYQAQTLRFYPIPNGLYPIGLIGVQRFDQLTDDTDSNAWTTDAFDLIRSEAKAQIAREVLYDAEAEASASRAIYGDPNNPYEIGYLSALKGETSRRIGRGRIIPTSF